METRKNQLFVVCAVALATRELSRLQAFIGSLAEATAVVLVVQRPTDQLDDGPSGLVAEISAISSMPATDCEHGQTVRGGNIYIAPPNVTVGFRAGQFHFEETGKPPSSAVAADVLLRSVAEHFQDRSAGLVIADDPATGVFGLEAITSNGGLAMAIATSPDGARPGDDRPDLFARVVDVMAPAADLAAALDQFARQLSGRPDDAAVDVSAEDLSEICAILREATGHDFRHYKETTLSRRVLRRIKVRRNPTVRDYIQHLRTESEEARTLMRDLLIGVTSFFRDAESFDVLQTSVLGQLISSDRTEPVRIWVPGCGTGREAYSIGILAAELVDKTGSKQDVHIFATDLDDRALAVARKGIYPANIVDEVGPARLERFFEKAGTKYQVRQDLRQRLVFSPHNLIADPPFSRMDLISCRNVLIYMGQPLQKKLMSVFHYALREGGYLFLGSSESVSGHGDLFRAVDTRHRIAQRKESGVRNAALAQPVHGSAPPGWQSPVGPRSTDIGAIAQRILLDEFAPPFAIANEDGQILYLSSGIDRFLRPIEGPFVNSIMRMTRTGLRVGLRSAWSRAQETRRTAVFEGMTLDSEGSRRNTRLTVQPMPELGEAAGNYMVVFDDQGPAQSGEKGEAVSADSERLVEQLEVELLRTREELEKTVQDLEAANEELKSSNEELLSMNEELQSANEELESSKDEIERMNVSLASSNNDLLNLLRSTEIATVFLDQDSRVRSFTPAASRLYNLTQADVGRPLFHFTHNFEILPDLPDPAEVHAATDPIEHEVTTLDGSIYLRRVTAYRDADGLPSGMVVTFVDMSEHSRIRAELSRSNAELRSIYDNAPVGLCLVDRDMRFLSVNSALAETSGVPVSEHIGRTIPEVVPGLADAVAGWMQKVFARGITVGPFELTGETPKQPGFERTWLETWAPIKDQDGRVTSVSISALEITGLKRIQDDLERSLGRLELALEAGQMGIWDWNLVTGAMEWTDVIFTLAGYDPETDEASIESWRARVHPDDLARVENDLANAEKNGDGLFVSTYRFLRPDGIVVHVTARAQYFYDDAGRAVRLVGVLDDVTRLRAAEDVAELNRRRMESVYRNAPVGLAYHDRELRWRAINEELAATNGYPVEAHLGKTPRELQPELADLIEPLLEEVFATGRPWVDFELHEPAGLRQREDRWWLVNFDPVINEGGGVTGVNVAVQDITPLKRAEAQRELLMAELNHRVKNSLATIQAIASHTLRTAPDPETFAETFLARLRAISAAHEILNGQENGGAGLEELIRRQVRPYTGEDETRLRLSGPQIKLGADHAHALGLVLHELATNAAKYGALSDGNGHIAIEWHLTPASKDSTLILLWTERDGPRISSPTRKGFGSRLIEQSLSHSLGGNVELQYEPEGFSANLEIPLESQR